MPFRLRPIGELYGVITETPRAVDLSGVTDGCDEIGISLSAGTWVLIYVTAEMG